MLVDGKEGKAEELGTCSSACLGCTRFELLETARPLPERDQGVEVPVERGVRVTFWMRGVAVDVDAAACSTRSQTFLRPPAVV
jgi:hypothetical protein